MADVATKLAAALADARAKRAAAAQGGDAMQVDPQPLPVGWTAVADASGETFFHNAESGETSWERPGAPQPSEDAATGGGLARGWQEVAADPSDPDAGVFYHNAITGETSWEHPGLAEEEAAAAADDGNEAEEQHEKEEEEEEELPPGWKRVLDEETGEEYFYNERPGESVWD